MGKRKREEMIMCRDMNRLSVLGGQVWLEESWMCGKMGDTNEVC
jgi:hypothetical protein